MRRLLLLGLAVLTMVSCTKVKTPQSRVLQISITTEPISIDPRKTGDWSSCLLAFMLYEGLTHQEEDGSIRLAAAESVQISSDRKTYRFVLRNALWSNGCKVRARDFEYAWKSALRPNFPSPTSYLFYPIKNARNAKEGKCSSDDVGVRAITDRELLVELEQPTPYFLELISFCSFFPICEHEEMVNPDWTNHPSSSTPTNGPFKLASWQHQSEITVEKNHDHWDAQNLALNGISINILDNYNTALQLFEKKKIDWLGGAFLPADNFSIYEGTTLLKKDLVAGTAFIAFNLSEYPFDNINIRKAFSYAIDRQSIVRNIGKKRPAGCLIPPNLCKDNLTTNYFKGATPKLANIYFAKGLQELGITKEQFPQIRFSYFNNETEKQVAQALQNQWFNELGINVELQCLDMKVFLDNMYKKNYKFAQFGAMAQYSDAMNLLERFRYPDESKNYSGWNSEKYRQLLKAAMNESSQAERLAIYHEAEHLIMEDMPICPLYFTENTSLVQPYLQGVSLSPIGATSFRHAKIVNQKTTESL